MDGGSSQSTSAQLHDVDAHLTHRGLSGTAHVNGFTSLPSEGRSVKGFDHDEVKAPQAEFLSSKKVESTRRRRDKDGRRNRRMKAPGVWKKILWVKQSYPDNYTDPPTFLSHLQFNPRLVPYDFWPLVADSTVIVQHVCSVAIFICCFVVIYQERVSPVSVVSWGSACTFLGWLFWDMWIGQEEQSRQEAQQTGLETTKSDDTNQPAPNGTASTETASNDGLGLSFSTPSSVYPSRIHSRNLSTASLPTSHSSAHLPLQVPPSSNSPSFSSYTYIPPYNAPASLFSPRWQQRLATAKSAILIYCALLGLSPILKSLTKSTTSDSIWAMSTWLMLINVFFFDYGSGMGLAKYQSSLSTNAALMASTVLASRLPHTTHVFPLTLFSIEVFGLFPVFRRHLRHRSWELHVLLTVLLILAAGAALGVTLVDNGGWKAAMAGAVVWGLGNVLVMGGCSWWLIGLQKYKNVVIGPWDPARPVIRAGNWD